MNIMKRMVVSLPVVDGGFNQGDERRARRIDTRAGAGA
jgi:hypothetical protein